MIGFCLYMAHSSPYTLPEVAMPKIEGWYAVALVMRKSSVLTVGTFVISKSGAKIQHFFELCKSVVYFFRRFFRFVIFTIQIHQFSTYSCSIECRQGRGDVGPDIPSQRVAAAAQAERELVQRHAFLYRPADVGFVGSLLSVCRCSREYIRTS